MRVAEAALVALLAFGCAWSTVRDGEAVYTARAFGAAHAIAGRCDRVSSDSTSTTQDRETRTTRYDERGTLCAVADGGHGSVGLWATIAGALAALASLVAL